MRKVLVLGLHEESNSFNPQIEQYSLFENFGIYDKEAIVCGDGKSGYTIKGMLTALKENGISAIGGLTLRADSGGVFSHTIVDKFLQTFEQEFNEYDNIGSYTRKGIYNSLS